MADEPVLQQGSEDEWVTYLQQQLEAAGFSPGAIDGVFGPRTDEAVRAYQASQQLVVDGIVGPKTWGALNWTWDWSEFPILSEIASTGGDENALVAAVGGHDDESVA